MSSSSHMLENLERSCRHPPCKQSYAELDFCGHSSARSMFCAAVPSILIPSLSSWGAKLLGLPCVSAHACKPRCPSRANLEGASKVISAADERLAANRHDSALSER